MSGLPDWRAVSISTAGYEDGLGRRSVRFDREVGGMLECLHLRPELAAFEASLRERADAINALDDERFVRVRGIERTGRGLVVVSELVPGQRLVDVIETRQKDDSPAFGMDAAFGFLLQALPALSTLHAAGIAHGTLAPGRIFITPAAQVVLLDGIYAAALERLNLKRSVLWASLNIMAPPSAGATRFDRQTDMGQAAMCALLLALGQQAEGIGDTSSLARLAREVGELAEIRAGADFAAGVQQFFSATLPLGGRRPVIGIDDAAAEADRLAALIGEEACHAAFADLTRFETATARAGGFELEEAAEVEEPLVAPPPRRTSPVRIAEPPVVPIERAAPVKLPPPPPVAAPAPPAPPTPPPAPVIATATPAPVLAVPAPEPIAVPPPSPPPAPAATPMTIEPPALLAPPAPAVPFEPVLTAHTVVAPPQVAYVPPVPPPTFAPAPLAPPPVAFTPAPVPFTPAPPTFAPPTFAPPTFVAPAPIAPPAPPSPPIGIAPSQPGTLRVRAEPPAGFTPPRSEAGSSIRALPMVNRPVSEERSPFRWQLAAAAVLVLIVGAVAGKSYLTGETAPAPGATAPRGSAAAETVAVPQGGTKGGLAIDSQPTGAKVTLDGEEVGVTPLKLEAIEPGRHTVAIITPTATVRRTVRVEAGKVATLDIPVYSGWIAVFSPIPLDISAAGKALGNTETGKILLPPGRHLLTLSNRDFGFTDTRTVEIYPGEERALNIEPKGLVNVNAHPWAEVWVDGKKAGDTPIANLQVPLGTRVFMFKHPQYGERRITATITTTIAALSVDFTKPANAP